MTASHDLPETMTAILAQEPGGPEVLEAREAPVPAPGEGELLIRVHNAGVNRPDVVQRKGLYPPPPGAPDIFGLEIAGTVVALGDGVDAALLGSRQCALVSGGGYAQYCLADAGHCLPVPEGLDLAEAAAMPETTFTVWHNLFQRGAAKAGDTVLVHGGTSGIGTTAIALGNLFGLRVVVTCGSDDKCERALALGAHAAINYREKDFVEEVARLTGESGVAVVLDMVSGDYVARNMACLAEDGRHVTIAVMGGVRAQIPMHVLMTRRLTLTGSTLRPRDKPFKSALRDAVLEHVWPHVAAGRLRPVMDRAFPLADAAAAHARMEAGEHVGKIVLEVSG